MNNIGKGIGKALGEFVDNIYFPEEEPEYRMVQTGYEIKNAEFDDDGNIVPDSLKLSPTYKRVRINPPPKRPELVPIENATMWNYMFKTGFYDYRREPELYPEGWDKKNGR